MPELPEVETIKTAVQKAVTSSNITRVRINNNHLRIKIPDDFAQKITNQKIIAVRRRAKYLLIDLANHLTVIWHLGMSGKIKISDKLLPVEKHDHVIIETDKGIITYNDPRRFGLMTYDETKNLAENKIFAKMGPEPWSEKFNANYLFEKFKNKNISVKQALLEQDIVVGIGNIYASEILYQAKIIPLREACKVSLNDCKILVKKTREVLEKAIAAGGSTLRDYKKPDGSLGYFQNQHCVYNKTGQKCPDCTCDIQKSGGIRKIVQGGRSSFYCPIKQK